MQLPLDQAIQYSKDGKVLIKISFKDMFIIDIRNQKEFNNYRIPGTKNITVDDFLANDENIVKTLEKKKNIYIYGQNYSLISLVISILKYMGYNNVVNMSKGYIEQLIKERENYQKRKYSSNDIDSDLMSFSEESSETKARIQNIDYSEQEYIHPFVEEVLSPNENVEQDLICERKQSINDDQLEKGSQMSSSSSNQDEIGDVEDVSDISTENKDRFKISRKDPAFQLKNLRLHHSRLSMDHLNFNKELNKEEIEDQKMEGITYEHLFNMPRHKIKRTKLVCTIGPVTCQTEQLIKMIDAGMNIARFNLVHSDYEFHAQSIKNLKDAMKKRPFFHLGIMIDTRGPQIRTGDFEQGIEKIQLKTGDKMRITINQAIKGNQEIISCNYEKLIQTVKIDTLLTISDGFLKCIVREIFDDSIIVEIQNNYELYGRQSLHIPGCQIDLPTISEQDEEDLSEFVLNNKVDFIAISYTRSQDDIEEVRDILGPRGAGVSLIAKIECLEAIQNFDEILMAADAIMIARSKLALDIPSEKVVVAQKLISKKCSQAGKPFIIANELFESMVYFRRPIRCESLDVANAVLDGTDCLLLSKETAIGEYPLECIETLSHICIESELCMYNQEHFDKKQVQNQWMTKKITELEALCQSAVQITFDLKLPLIIVFTRGGTSAKLLSKLKPKAYILAVSDSADTIRSLTLVAGVQCLRMPSIQGCEVMYIKQALQKAMHDKLCKLNDKAVILYEDVNYFISIKNVREEVESLNRENEKKNLEILNSRKNSRNSE